MERLCKTDAMTRLQCLLQLLLLLVSAIAAQGTVRLQVVENSPIGSVVGAVESDPGVNRNYRFDAKLASCQLASYIALICTSLQTSYNTIR